MTGTTVLLVPVPEVEATIDPLRRRLDPSWRTDMPAHVTLLVPFAPPERVSDEVIGQLQALFAECAAFEFSLRRTRWFDERVLYLAPEPAEGFRRMTQAIAERFPDYPPYEGAFPDVIPHVTIGESGRWRKRRRAMRQAEAQFEEMTPIAAHAAEVWLMERTDASPRWRRTATFPLGGVRHPLLPHSRAVR